MMTKKWYNSSNKFEKSSKGEGVGLIQMNDKKVFITDIRNIMICVCHQNNTIDKQRFLEHQQLEVKLDEKILEYSNVRSIAKNRIREIRLWSNLKKELDDGTFDIINPDTHKKDSLNSIITHRIKSFSPGTGMSEIFNTLGLKDSYEKVIKENQLKNYDQEREKLISQKNKIK